MWNLGGSDTPSQNVLESLEGNDHGQILGRMVRLFRLTRPEVMITWLPEFVTGENHSDHQASGVLATEAFDLAGDPTAFPEQVSPAIEPGHVWAVRKGFVPGSRRSSTILPTQHTPIFMPGKAPNINATDISPTRHVSYGEIAAESFSKHMTQQSSSARALGARELSALAAPDP